jgi:putative phosphoesterase
MERPSSAITIGVLSDTHARSLAEISPRILDTFSGVDLIVHAGDLVSRSVLDGLKRLKEVRAVRGNMDSYDLALLLPQKELLYVGGRRIGITHGTGSPFGIVKRVRAMFEEVDVIIYGHSHTAQNKVVDGVLFFNPGTARRSFGLLTIGDEIRGEIIKV